MIIVYNMDDFEELVDEDVEGTGVLDATIVDADEDGDGELELGSTVSEISVVEVDVKDCKLSESESFTDDVSVDDGTVSDAFDCESLLWLIVVELWIALVGACVEVFSGFSEVTKMK